MDVHLAPPSDLHRSLSGATTCDEEPMHSHSVHYRKMHCAASVLPLSTRLPCAFNPQSPNLLVSVTRRPIVTTTWAALGWLIVLAAMTLLSVCVDAGCWITPDVNGAVKIPPGTTTIPANAFYGCSTLVSVTIPATVTYIGNSAFRSCRSLISVSIASGSVLVQIDEYAFDGARISSFAVPASVTSIGKGGFYNCNLLQSLIIAGGSSLAVIGEDAFHYCSSLTSVVIPSDSILATIGNSAFQDASISSLAIPATVTSIGSESFNGCSSLTSVSIASGSALSAIGYSAFKSTAINSVVLPPSLTLMGSQAFASCASLASVTVMCGSTVAIPSDAFSGNTQLTRITLADTATYSGTVPTLNVDCRPTGQPTSAPTNPTGQPTSTPTNPTGQPTGQPTGEPSMQPTGQPTRQPTAQPSSRPSRLPTGQPTGQPSRQPTGQPSRQPTGQPTGQPTRQPTSQPTGQPTAQPSSRPSRLPTGQPTGQPTRQPTAQPSRQPTGQPTGEPSRLPTGQPTGQPTRQPTGQPSRQPSTQPTGQPTGQPNGRPTGQPTAQPSSRPTRQPSSQPSSRPTRQPSSRPTGQPTRQPTGQPSVTPTSYPTLKAGKAENVYIIAFPQSQQFSGETIVTNLGTLPTQTKVYMTLLLYQIGWKSDESKYITFSAWSRGKNTWTELVLYFPPTAPKDFTCLQNSNPYAPVEYNIDVTQYVLPEQGGSFRIRTDVSKGVQPSATKCMYDKLYPVYLQMRITTMYAQPTFFPTEQPTDASDVPAPNPNPPVPAVAGFGKIEFSLNTAYQIGVLVAIASAALGVYFAVLRKKTRAVVIAKPTAGVLMGLIGGEVATSVILIANIFKAKNDGWAIIITLMRLLHMVVAFAILITIYGPDSLQAYTNFSKLLDSDHMSFNPKMYGLASVVTIFDINAFILLPWRDSAFAHNSFGLPNMSLFRTVQFTTVFTGVVNIATQAQYMDSRPFEAINYFFYSNIAIQAGKTIVSCFAYCILASKLRSSATAATDGSDAEGSFGIAKAAATAATTIEDGDGGSGAIELVDMVPNPLQSSNNARTNTWVAAAAASSDAMEALHKKVGDMDRIVQEQQREHARLQEQYEQERARSERERHLTEERQREFARELELLRQHMHAQQAGAGGDVADAAHI